MRVVQYVILVLTAHAQALQRLAALMGEEVLIELLEDAGEKFDLVERVPITELPLPWDELQTPPATGPQGGPNPFQEIETAVLEMNLAQILKFYLWGYPFYRSIIESSLNLNATIPSHGGNLGLALADEALRQSQLWVQKLPLPPQLGLTAEQAVQFPWVRFRTTVLQRVGKRPMGPVG